MVESTKPATAAEQPWTVRRVLEWTTGHLKKNGSETPRLDTEILLAHARGCRRIQLYTDFDVVLSDDVRARMRDLVQRRAKAEPVAYLVGHREFYSLDFQVTPDVLIPRPDTETLVLAALELAKPLESPRVLDLGTGSGCVAIAISVNHKTANVTAVDLSDAALEVARGNAERHKVADRIRFLHGDLFIPLEAGEQFNLIVSNPPYISTADIERLHEDVRLHEPHSALDGGPNGLAVIERIIADAADHLRDGGALLLEMSPEQAEKITRSLESTGRFTEITTRKDMAGKQRVIRARKSD